MENPAVTGLRSRSRSKTPLLEAEHNHKSGRKTPVSKTTIAKLSVLVERHTPEPPLLKDIYTSPPLVEDIYTSPPAHRTRAATAAAVTSDYSSEESPDTLRSKEVIQNKINSHYEYSRVTTSSTAHRGYDTTGAADFRLSPSKHSSPYPHHVYNASLQRSYSPAHSACSTDSSFAEQALADVSHMREKDLGTEHLPYKLYKMAGEYWNKYPKTDYTYSPLSRDRVELAPGQVAVPNMSRRSLAQYRVTGNLTSPEELDQLLRQHGAAWRETYESSEDECVKRANGGGYLAARRPAEQRWWLTRLLIAIYTTITTTVTETTTSLHEKITGRNRYTATYSYAQPKRGLVSRSMSTVAAPLVWMYSVLKTVVTTTTTTITNTITGGNTEADGGYYRRGAGVYSAGAVRREERGRRWWPWLLVLPLLGYGSYYTYENFDKLALPDFSDMELALPEFSLPSLPNLAYPTFNISLPELNISLPDIDLSLPDMPDVPQAYYEYKEIAQDRLGDASEYVKVVASSCFEEIRRIFPNGVF